MIVVETQKAGARRLRGVRKTEIPRLKVRGEGEEWWIRVGCSS